MLFNSFEFLGFLLVVFAVYYLLPLGAAQIGWLILSSLVFYGADDPKLVFLLLFSVALNFFFSWLAGRGPLRLRFLFLVLGVVLNLAVLTLFKYAGLINTTLDRILLPHDMPLPIGISFFTFEGIMILVDCWRSNRQQELRSLVGGRMIEHLGRVGLLMSFFPHLVSGPIVKARDFFPQMRRKFLREINWDVVFRCLTVGYFLKLVVADNLKEQTCLIQYPDFGHFSTIELSALLFGYSMQIFADFAGYSLMAIGLAALFGYVLPENFRFPYLAASFSEFWQRWHISLSSFLREYLYIPLGGNRKGLLRTYLNIFIVMGLGGLWHGAAWSYAIWGLAHGTALVAERMLGSLFPRIRLWRPLRILVVFTYVSCAWLLFRLPEFEQVQLFVKGWMENTQSQTNWRMVKSVVLFSIPVWLYHVGHLYSPQWLKRYEYLLYGTLMFLILVNSGPPATFIYFQF